MPATPSVTSPFSITPLLSRWSSTSRTVESGASRILAATTGAAVNLGERAISSILHERVRRPWPRDRQAVSLTFERFRLAGGQRLERGRARPRHEECRVEQERTAFQ